MMLSNDFTATAAQHKATAPASGYIPDHPFYKYNSPTLYKVDYSQRTLEALKLKYHDMLVPNFMLDLLQVTPEFSDVRLLKQYPGMIEWSEDGTAFILPDFPDLPDAKNNIYSPSALKQLPDGFPLGVWYVHPALLQKSVFRNRDIRNNFQSAASKAPMPPISLTNISDIEKETGTPYLASIFDLTPQDLPYLESLKKLAHRHLQQRYEISETDLVELLFHSITATVTTTLHMHVNVNQQLHPLNRHRCFSMDEIKDALENGQTGLDLVSSRSFYLGKRTAKIMDGLPDAKIHEVENPFIAEIA